VLPGHRGTSTSVSDLPVQTYSSFSIWEWQYASYEVAENVNMAKQWLQDPVSMSFLSIGYHGYGDGNVSCVSPYRFLTSLVMCRVSERPFCRGTSWGSERLMNFSWWSRNAQHVWQGTECWLLTSVPCEPPRLWPGACWVFSKDWLCYSLRGESAFQVTHLVFLWLAPWTASCFLGLSIVCPFPKAHTLSHLCYIWKFKANNKQ
jgi:hypothetical protein